MNASQPTDDLQQAPVPAPEEMTAEEVHDEGKGLISPLEIHSQTTVVRRRGFEMFEDVIPAFIKISTGFKAELKNINATALKVWVYLALSINRNTEQAHPGIRTIAEACGIGQNTAIAAVRELERLGLLLVNRKDRKYNIYEIPAYVSANTRTASKTEAVKETASGEDETASQSSQTASEKLQTASASQRLNQINQINQTNQKESTTTRENAGEVFVDTPDVDNRLMDTPTDGVSPEVEKPQANNRTQVFTRAEITAAVFKAYTDEIGCLTPHVSNAIGDYLDDLRIPPEWIIDSFHIAAENQKRNWAYCAAILKRWAVEGKTTLPPKINPPGSKYPNKSKSFYEQVMEA